MGGFRHVQVTLSRSTTDVTNFKATLRRMRSSRRPVTDVSWLCMIVMRTRGEIHPVVVISLPLQFETALPGLQAYYNVAVLMFPSFIGVIIVQEESMMFKGN